MTSSTIAKNTVALFMRQMVVLAINLYTIRALLAALGIEDFALFNVLTNVVMLGSFVPAALITIAQRYFAYALGRQDPAALKRVHDASVAFCIGISALVVLGLETAGVWFVSHHLVIDPDKLVTAKILFQLLIVYFTINNLSSFYSAIVMAHEDMHIFAAFSLGDTIVRLVAVVAIGFVATDRLLLIGILQCVGAAGVLAAYVIYCRRNYAECRAGRIRFEGRTLREMLGFAGWTVFGQLTTISRNQAVTILINQTFNPATVAARSLASSVSMQVLNFSTNFSSALHPPIIKAHAADEREKMFELIYAGSKITFFLVWIATLPIIFAMPGILRIWLGNYPEQTVIFTRLALVENAITAVSFPLMTAVRATGRMRLYELSLGCLQLLVLIVSWLLVRAGYPASSIYVVAIVVNLMMFGARLMIASHQTKLPALGYMRRVVLPIILAVAGSLAVALALLRVAPTTPDLRPLSTAAGVVLATILATAAIVYLVGLTRQERQAMKSIIGRKLGKMGKRA